MAKIVTHPGQAHRDDFISVCVILDHLRESFDFPTVERREPTAEELLDPSIWVVDVGGDFNPALRNFDHHQFPKDYPNRCALSLVLEDLGLDSAAKLASGEWVDFTEVLDCKGPFVAASHIGITREQMLPLESPIESQLLRLWQSEPDTAVMKYIMAEMGKQWRKYWVGFQTRMKLLKETCSYTPTVGTKGVLFVAVDRNDNPSLAVEKFCQQQNIDPSVIISQDDRGLGYSLYRRNDDKSIDFRQIKDNPQVIFAHSNGFIAKTVEGLGRDDLLSLVQQSVVPVVRLTEIRFDELFPEHSKVCKESIGS